MVRTKTAAYIRHAVISILRGWRSGSPFLHPDPRLVHVLSEQETIGHQNLIFGLLSKRWAQLQQLEYDRKNSRRSGKRWAAALVQKLWDVAWDQWNQRNSVLHSGDKISEYFDPDHVEMEIRVEYAMGAPNPLPFHHRRWFAYSTVDQILSKSGYDRRLWLATVRNIRAASLNHLNQDGYAGMRQVFYQWLATANPELDQPA